MAALGDSDQMVKVKVGQVLVHFPAKYCLVVKNHNP